MKTAKTAGIIIIGNEILSGKVQDINSFYLASELRGLGVDVQRITVIPDDTVVIGQEAVLFSGKYDYVFTSGGVGPTHDDVTMAGIARGFQVSLKQDSKITNLFSARYGSTMNQSVLKMAMVPEGSTVEFHDSMKFPVVSFRNIYIFPGIPEYMQNKFSMIREKFRTSAFHLKRLYLNCHESVIAGALNAIVEKYGDVTIGSYPVLGMADFQVIVTAETKCEESLRQALDDLVQTFPENCLIKVE